MIGIVVSRFNVEVTEKLLEGAVARLHEEGLNAASDYQVFHVPGAVELPLIAQSLCKTRRFRAVICLGAVIRGETSHYDYVCQQVSYGCQRVMLDHEVPVIFGVLTTENRDQAVDRVGGRKGHKGRDAAEAALAMIDVIDGVNGSMEV